MLSEWLAAVFSSPGPYGLMIIAGKTAVIYLFLVGGLRLMGKRELGQMTIYDVVLIIVLANAVQNAMVGDDTTLGGGIAAAVTLLAFNRLFNFLLSRSRTLERTMVGGARLIVNHGRLLPDRMAREGVTRDQVMAALREHGLHDLAQVRLVVLEVDGTMSVVPEDSDVYRTRRHFRSLRLP